MNKAVIGLGFGDEGKGRVVDWLCSEANPKPVVVRFSGGGQAGHTVVLAMGTRHVFSNIGSGTFQGCRTFWSQHCTFDPSAFMTELKDLNTYKRAITVHPKCPVITPYDILAQRDNASNLGHGTVGCGVGTTFQREEDHYHLLVEDLFHPTVLRMKLELIRQHYVTYRAKLGGKLNWPVPAYEESEAEQFLADCEEVLECIVVRPEINTMFNRIYEGSQGLLLDQDTGFFPHVTRSNTSTKNLKTLPDYSPRKTEFYGVTRAYQTRHGNGPMTNEGHPCNDAIKLSENETNVNGGHQGEFRTTVLDADLLLYGLDKDPTLKGRHRRDVLVVTCVDEQLAPSFTHEGKTYEFSTAEEMANRLRDLLKFNRVLISKADHGPLTEVPKL